MSRVQPVRRSVRSCNLLFAVASQACGRERSRIAWVTSSTLRTAAVTAIAGVGGLGVSTASAAPTNYYWDPGLNASGSGSGGTGTWDTSTSNWFSGSTDVAWPNTTAFAANFNGTAGTVTLGSANISAGGLVFGTAGYGIVLGADNLSIDASGINVTASAGITTLGLTTDTGVVKLTAAQTWNVAAGEALVVNDAISSATILTLNTSSNVTFAGGGTVTAGAVNSGLLTISAGTCNQSGTAQTFTNNGTLNISGGTLLVSTGNSLRNTIVGSVINLNGGNLTAAGTGNILVGHAGRAASLNLISGELDTSTALTSDAVTANAYTVNFSGATIKATATLTDLINSTYKSSFVLNDVGGGGGAIFNTNTFNVTIAENINTSGTGTDGGITKLGTGTLTLGGSNSFTGNVNITQGTLAVTAAQGATTSSAIPTGANVNVSTGATFGVAFQGSDAATLALVLNNFNLNLSTGSSVSFGGPNRDIVTLPGNITLNGSPTFLTGNIREEMKLSGVVSGTGNFSFNVAGGQSSSFIVMSGANTYTGSTSVYNNNTAGASLQIAGGADRLPTTTTLTLTGAASFQTQFDLNGQNQTLAGLLAAGTVANADVVNNNSSTTSILTINNSGSDSFTGIIGAPAQTLSNATVAGTNVALAKSGAGVLTLTAANGYTGGTTVNAGEVYADSTLNLPLASGAVSVSAGANVTIGDHAGSVPNLTNNFTLNGAGASGSSLAQNGVLGYGALGFFNSANFNISGSITLASNSVIRSDPVNQTAAVTFSGLISGPGSLTLEGGEDATAGGYPHFVLTQANTYGTTTPATLLTSDGVNPQPMLVELSTVNNVLPASTILTFGGAPAEATNPTAYNKNITLALNGISQTVAGLTNGSNGTYLISGNSTTLSTFTVANSSPNTFSGTIGGSTANAANISLVVSGSSTLTLTGINNYSGGTLITSGTLTAGAPNALSALSAFNVSGGTLDASAFNTSVASLTVGASGSLNLGIGNVLTVNPSAVSGIVTLLSGSTLNLTGTPGILPQTLLSYNSVSGTFTNVPFVPAGDSLVYGPNALQLVSNGPAALSWTNASGNGMWDISTSANFNTSSGATVTYSDTSNSTLGAGDSVSFTDNNGGLANYNVSIATVVHPTSTTVNNSTAGYTFNGPGGIAGPGGLTKLGSASLTLGTVNTYGGPTNVSGGSVLLAVAGALPSGTNLTIGSSASLVANNLGNATGVKVGSLSVTGILDLNNNVLAVHNSSLGAVTALVQSGFNSGGWNGPTGIISTTAASDSKHLTALGVITNDNGSSTPLYGSGGTIAGTIDGITPADGDILVKYTYYGDANLDGKVDGSDYSRIDSSFVAEQSGPALSGWYNGDFNYDGVVNGSDYTLIDNAYNTQGASLAAELATPTAESTPAGGTSAVPEPTTLGVIGIGAIGLLGRKRRR